jgi:enediyne biosynthesis protein E2
MPTTMLGAIRKRLIAPPMSLTSFAVRGFRLDSPGRAKMEESARQFGLGFELAIEQKGNDAIAERLELLEWEYRGFAYEGATMALTLRDVMSPAPGNKNVDSFAGHGGPADHQVFMVYIGIGFALARLPKFLWRRAIPTQSVLPEHRALNWMILDGYSFHEAFFKTQKWVHEQYVSPPVPWKWKGSHDWVLKAMDHGIGRAMWFINGGDSEQLANMINKFDPARRSDLWSGAALAATYAGGVDEEGLSEFAKRSSEYRREVAQGAVFALKQRVMSNLITPHTELASQIFCERSPEEAASITDWAATDLPDTNTVPAYEIFRQRIQSKFSA